MGKLMFAVSAERIVHECHGLVTADSAEEAAEIVSNNLSKDGSKFKSITLLPIAGSPSNFYTWTPGFIPLGHKEKV